jgi:hypothetical protein
VLQRAFDRYAANPEAGGQACRHCSGGCTIYQTRPQPCRDFLCGWRKLDILGPEWRPDLSGILAQIETDDIPAASGFAAGIGLMLVGNPLKTLRQKFFLDFVTTGIVSDIPLFLSLPARRDIRRPRCF